MDQDKNDPWQPPEPFEIDWPVEDWGRVNVDGFDWLDHLMPGGNPTTSPNHVPDITTQSPDAIVPTGLDSPDRRTEEPPVLASLADRSRLEPLGTIKPNLDLDISGTTQHLVKDSTPSSYSSANIWTPSHSSSEGILPYLGSGAFPPSTGTNHGGGSIDSSSSENASYSRNSHPSSEAHTILVTQDDSEWGLGGSPWMWPQETGIAGIQSEAVADELAELIPFELIEQAAASLFNTTDPHHSVPLASTGEYSLLIPVCVSPSPNQAPLGTLPDLGAQDQHEAKRKHDEDDTERREQTRKVRSLGACLRCRIYKEKCDLNVPCGRCVQVSISVKLFRQPCQRLDLTDVIPFRTGNARMGQKQSEFPILSWSLQNPLIRITSVTHVFEGVDVALLPKLKLQCRQFMPTAEHVLFEHYEGTSGEVMVVASPAFACANIGAPKTKAALKEYIQNLSPFAIQEVIATSTDEIYRQGLAEAKRIASINTIPMLQKALEILACVYINFDTPIMVGDTLDVLLLEDKRAPIDGRHPIPSVLDFQLDTLYIQHMQKLMKAVSRELKNLIFSNEKQRQSHWYLRGANIARGEVNIFAHASPVTNYMVSLWRASAKKPALSL